MRQVIHKDGLTLPGGHHLPQNAWVGFSTVDINRDDNYYVDPDQFEPFRFVKSSAKPSSDIKPLSPASQDVEGPTNDAYLVTAEDKFMNFGYGRHSWYGIISLLHISNSIFTLHGCIFFSCNHVPVTLTNKFDISSPGRWFAAHLLKLLVAYTTLNYEIQPIAKRPQNTVFGDSIVPSWGRRIKVRRRKHAE